MWREKLMDWQLFAAGCWDRLRGTSVRVTNDAEHEEALERLKDVWDATEGAPLAELRRLVKAIDAYERKRWPL